MFMRNIFLMRLLLLPFAQYLGSISLVVGVRVIIGVLLVNGRLDIHVNRISTHTYTITFWPWAILRLLWMLILILIVQRL
jgi:ACR3 family arsenite efflux pump ArsB